MECDRPYKSIDIFEIDSIITARSYRDCLNKLAIPGLQVIFRLDPLGAEDWPRRAPDFNFYTIVPGLADGPLDAQGFIDILGER